MVILIWICIKIWNCINTRNLSKLYEKSNVLQYLYTDKLDIILNSCLIIGHDKFIWDQFIITQKGIKAIGQLVNGDVTLCEECVFDYLTIQWDNINLSQHDLDLWLPSNPLSVLDIRIILRRLLTIPIPYS